MLAYLGFNSMDELVDSTVSDLRKNASHSSAALTRNLVRIGDQVPAGIRLAEDLQLSTDGMGEQEALSKLRYSICASIAVADH